VIVRYVWHDVDRRGVEATCKSLVTVRMKRPGARRWKHTTGDEVIVGVVSVHAAVNTNRTAAPDTSGHGARGAA
jgi:hypothetical protein